MKTKTLHSLMMICGVLFCLSFINALFWIVYNLNFWHLIGIPVTAILSGIFGMMWTKHVQYNPNKIIKTLTRNKDE